MDHVQHSAIVNFIFSNPPYRKSWKNDLERMGGKGDTSYFYKPQPLAEGLLSQIVGGAP